MSDYDDDRNRFRNRYYDEDFDYEGGYGRRFDEERGTFGRGMDYERGYYGRGSDFDRPNSGQNFSRYGQNRGGMNRRGNPQDWDYDRGNDNRGGYGQGFDRSYGGGYDTNRSMYGRGMDYDRGYFNQDYWQNYGRYGQNRGQIGRGMTGQNWDYDRGYTGQSGFPRRGYNPGYGYNRDYNPMDWDTDYDVDFDADFEPVDFTYMEFWMIPGPETGRGPQGYQRADDRIKEDVCDRLMQHGQIDASEMSVDVQNNEVTLSGMVNSRKAKRMAEDMAESVPGVTNVHNQLKVRQGERQGRDQRQVETTAHQQGQSPMGMSGQTGQQSEKR